MNNWSLLPLISAPMSFQMAFDEIVFRQMTESKEDHSRPYLRFYFSSEPWTTVGYSHPREDTSWAAGSKVCRRLTGGGVVHHGRDLIFSLIAQKKHDDSFRSVRESYRKIHWALQTGFRNMGERTDFCAKEQTVPRGGECFLHPIESDLAYRDKKIAGGAQKRSLGVMLHQESLQIKEAGAVRWATAEDEIKYFSDGFKDIFNIEIENTELDPGLISQAEELAKEKYSSI